MRKGSLAGPTAFAALALVAPWVILLPSLSRVGGLARLHEAGFLLVKTPALLRGLGVAAIVTTVSVAAAYALARPLTQVRGERSVRYLLPLLLLPTLLGSTSVGLVFNLCFASYPDLRWLLWSHPPWTPLAVIAAIHCWRWAPLLALVFWLRLVEEEKALRPTFASLALSPAEESRDFLWPRARMLTAILGAVVFLDVFYESAVAELAVRTSQGTDTALISQTSFELYRLLLPASSGTAADAILGNTVALTAAALLAAGTATMLLVRLGWLLVGLRSRLSRERSQWKTGPVGGRVAGLVLLGVAGAICAPILLPFCHYGVGVGPYGRQVVAALLVSAGGALVLAGASIVAAFLVRVAVLARHPGAAAGAAVLGVVLCPKAIPPLGIALGLYELVLPVASHGLVMAAVVWVTGQVLLGMPVLCAFALWIHSSVTTTELEFQRLAGVSSAVLFLRSFFQRFKGDYLFVLLFAWTLVWNDSLLPRVMPPRIPSFWKLLAPIVGPRPDYPVALLLVSVSLSASLVAAYFWFGKQTRRSLGGE